MRRLISDLFDELDDFLFCSVQPDQLAEGSTQMKLIREFRNKKQLFEEKFLASIDGALQSTLVPPSATDSALVRAGQAQKKESAYQRMELDLALERMERKAFKFYAQQIKKLSSSGRQGEEVVAGQVIPENRDLLIANTLRALASSQEVFRISLESRLVFFKLFEQHFLMKMEKLYQEVISIINNKDNRDFVDRLYTSSTSIHKRREKNIASLPPTASSADRSEEPLLKSERVEKQVNEIVETWCGNTDLPDFVRKMLRNTWHSVLFLLGLNSGVASAEWREAKQTVESLLKMIDGKERPGVTTLSFRELQERLLQGFELSHMPDVEQTEFFRQLEQLQSAAGSSQTISRITRDEDRDKERPTRQLRSFAAVSEAGRKILDNADLDDFVALLSDDQAQAVAETDEEAISMDYYLNMVDTMAEGAQAEFRSSGGNINCTVQKSASIENSYQVLDADGNVLLTRSRVGLAVSLRAGEIRLDGQEDFKPARLASQLSVIRTGAEGRRPTTH
jgi:hypothetical protein